jgi:hypothetical protein
MASTQADQSPSQGSGSKVQGGKTDRMKGENSLNTAPSQRASEKGGGEERIEAHGKGFARERNFIVWTKDLRRNNRFVVHVAWISVCRIRKAGDGLLPDRAGLTASGISVCSGFHCAAAFE